MRKRMLRSVLVAAFSAVVAFGSLSGLSGEKRDVRADTVWSVTAPVKGEDSTSMHTTDTVWS